MMASSDKAPDSMPVADESVPPGKPLTVAHQVIDKTAQMLQTLKPIEQMSQHVCTFAVYGHDMSRQIETHHYITRLNQDFLQCAVYDSHESSAHLIGVEYIVSDRILDTLPPDEQKLWHSHDHEVTSGLWVNPGVQDQANQITELANMAHTYGKFWCTWQVDRGDKLPLGAPALMMSPQMVNMGVINPELVEKRDSKFQISTEEARKARVDFPVSKPGNARVADYWMHTGNGFTIDIEHEDMKLLGGKEFP